MADPTIEESAQSADAPEPTADEPKPTADEPAEAPATPLQEALGWSGWKLDAYGSAGVGRVEGVFRDAAGSEPVWLLVRMGRFGHYSVVPYALAAAGVGRVWVPYERELIRQAPQVEPGTALNREQELALCTYFQIAEDQGRAAAVAGRPAGSETALPGSG